MVSALVPGYHSRIAFVDLSRGTVKVLEPGEEFYKLYIGGRGVAAKILVELVGRGVDPLSPDNAIVMAVGPLTGTPVPMSSRIHVAFKSPVTGAWGESSMGGSFPYFFKNAGLDALVIKGRSPKPVYLLVEDGRVEIRDAGHVWGADAYEAEEALVEECGGKALARAAVIGPAGENLVRYATVTHGSPRLRIGRGGQAARAGAGAVMGSKNLKGVVAVKGSPAPVADEARLHEYVERVLGRIVGSERQKALRTYGTSAMFDVAQHTGFLPTYYWSSVRYEHYGPVSAEALRSVLKSPVACTMCPAGCGRLVEASVGGLRVETEGPEYETMYAFGSLSGVKDVRQLALLNDLADRLGVDTISFGNVYAFAVEAQRAGRLKLPYRVSYGDHEAMARLMEDVSYGRGEHSKLLALGVAGASRAIGGGVDAVHVKGLEPAGYDPRGLWGMYLAFATSPRGACHLRSMAYMIDIRGLAGPRNTLSARKVEAVVEWEDWCSLFDSLTLCKFGRDFYPFGEMAEALNAVTGWGVDERWVREAGRRITALVHYYNRGVHGMGVESDSLPERWFRECAGGAEPASPEEVRRALAEYYRLRGFREDGTMPREALERLGVRLGDLGVG